ncbi:zinc carboxypeptidase-like [Anabrus simplex]|uniref:zinc carboxypeptidase-like n=1 Tax=Anabrus simplex TaxID=316456 RepID=UPI0035A394F6
MEGKAVILISSVLCVWFSLDVSAEEARFDNYKVFRAVPTTEDQMHFLRELSEGTEGISFWKAPTRLRSPVDIMVPPHKLPDFREAAGLLNLDTEVLIQDVQEAIYNERPSAARRVEGFDWTDYHGLEQMYSWMDSLIKQHSGVASLIIGGSSFEGRQIRGVKISHKSGNPGVYVEGGIHAREWISPATVTFILNQLLKSSDPDVRDIAENYDWYIFPSVNPDGYVYSHKKNRLWRKTRSRSSATCFGVDPNRNWDFFWNVTGTSGNPCSDIYAGPKPFSEIETRTLSSYITTIAKKIDVFLAFHSYSQLLLLPYGNGSLGVDNFSTLVDIGTRAMEKLSKRYGTRYTTGNIVDVIYPASGISMDWARSSFKIPFTFTYELRDTGRHGFLLPAKLIIPTGEETLDSVVSILQDVRGYSWKTTS